MAQKVFVQLVDDLDGTEGEDIETVQFGLDGVTYEIDLGQKNGAKLRDALADVVASARRTGGRARRGSVVTSIGTKPPAAGHTKEQSRAIREWAKSNGHELADRGRIPAGVAKAFELAHN
ncbi:Lsr2 family protein [Umezawaea sp. Da 62-37]|uniref:histone-like nucleoid-structuring protein Lsr2 n=1 Tax=Umezawaea sp. Da 62-37 TaxID=3075927 RepID=UPI0028F6CF0A|nr:Lsr2 family protein [Umezawaea sp. Da 62-37]WNV84888.1 Lsr2 family protein [Umezawaea sp. Da 62-37]